MDRKREIPRFRVLGEAKPATGFGRNRRWEAKPPTVFAEIGVGKQNLPPVSSKNGKNCEFRGQNHQKTEKTGFPHPGENQNHPFFAFPHPWESQKRPKTAFPHPGESQNHPFSAFLPREKSRCRS